jgi:hypothetical protein
MALIIVGDFDTESTKPMIEDTFGRLEYKELPARPSYPKTSFAGNPKHKFKMGYYPMVIWAYDGVNMTDEDLLPLQFVASLLNNSTNTGLLDKLNIDGIVSSAGVSVNALRDQGRIIIEAVPYYDANQQAYESNAATEKIVMAEINRLKNGDIPDWLIQTVKAEYAQNYKLAFEHSDTKMDALYHKFSSKFGTGSKKLQYTYMMCNQPVAAYDCRHNAFIGTYGHKDAPEALLENGGCTNSDCVVEKLCFYAVYGALRSFCEVVTGFGVSNFILYDALVRLTILEGFAVFHKVILAVFRLL